MNNPHLPNFYSINPIYDGLHGQSRISQHRQTAPFPMHTLPDKAAANAISSIRKPISTPLPNRNCGIYRS